MKKITFFNKTLTLFFLLALLFTSSVFAQLVVPFSPRLPDGNIRVRGDIVFIGNSIVTGGGSVRFNRFGPFITNENLQLPYNARTIEEVRDLPSDQQGGLNNNGFEGRYINVANGGDPDIFSSSSADLVIDNACNSIVYAGLYWSTIYPVDVANNRRASYEGSRRFEDWNQVKFRLPTGDFIDLVADNDPDPVGEEDEIILDGLVRNADGTINPFETVFDAPIVCYKNVTNLLQGLGIGGANGTYTVADLRATRGLRVGGCAGGWVLAVVYESPTEPSRFISVFDGYARVGGGSTANIDVNGFRTLPAPLPVNANIGVAALEGDIGLRNDSFLIKAATSDVPPTAISDAVNEANNFFNSSITNNGQHVTNRNPSSLNTLGFDINNVAIQNPNRLIIPNDETSARLTLTTSGDAYGAFMTAFSVEIIEPNIVLTKLVEDVAGNDIGNELVDLGDELNYSLRFQNTGNDDATDYTIRDILPINIEFDINQDIVSLPNGVRLRSYDPATRELVFEVDDNLVAENTPVSDAIRLRVKVVSTCSLLDDACSNIVSNQAFSTYRGVDNPDFVISDDPSFNTNTGCLIIPQATNFLSDLDCVFEEEVILCGDETVLTAGDGYDTYSWSRDPSGTPVIGTEQTLTVTEPGLYYANNTAMQPCQDIEQIFDVVTFGADVTNPLIPRADQVVQCPNDGLQMPNYFLCGANDSRFIQTAIMDANSIIWEVLDENSCPSVRDQSGGSQVPGIENCPNENETCVWNQVQIGPDFTIDTQGQYRITLNYNGGCFNRFYFNVFENIFEPTETHSDIVCDTPGEIRVGNVPSGYEFSLDANEPRTYQPENVFTVNTPGNYTVFIRQIGIMPNPCIFTIPNIQIAQRNFEVTSVLTQPACNGELGTITLAGNDANPEYTFILTQDVNNTTVEVDRFGPDGNNTHTFSGVAPGVYTINVTTEDGCTDPQIVEIINPPLLRATANITVPLTCTNGEITVLAEGGTPPYSYFVNSTTVFQTNNTIEVTESNTFNIRVVDANDCFFDIDSFPVNAVLAPDFNITKTDILCAGVGDTGAINVNVTNPNGNTLQYSIDNGVTFTAAPNFTSLPAGDFDVVIRYQIEGDQGMDNTDQGNDPDLNIPDADPDPIVDFCLTEPQPITINPATPIQATSTLTTPYSCTSDGVITLSDVTGGTAPYTYSIDGINFQPELIFPNLTDGSFTITVQDANSCTFVTPAIDIDPLNPPTALSFTNTALTCPDMTTNVTVTATNGRAPLEYRLVTGPNNITRPFQADNTFIGLEAGTYRFEVRDADNCILDNTFNIAPLPVLAIQEEKLNDITCFDDTDGRARFTVSGTTNFSYRVNNGPVIAGTTVINLTNLAAQDYTIDVTDIDTNCMVSASVTIEAPTAPLTVTVNESVISCIEPGRVVANPTGGWGGNRFTLTRPDNTVTPIQNSNIFTNLTQAGNYTLTVIDNRGCEATDTFSLTTPVNPTATISSTSDICFDGTNGATLEINASGGQPPYQYNINGGPFTTNNIFNNLTPGAYDITVLDDLGCTVALPREFIQDQLTTNAVLNKNLDCSINPDASFTVTFSGGLAAHTGIVSVSTDGGTTFTDTSLGTVTSPFNYTTAIAGIYRFQITDANSCDAISNTNTVNPIVFPDITSVTLVNPILCNDDANASISIVTDNTVGTPAFTLNVTNTTTNTNFGTRTSGLPAGDYTVTLTDANFCTDVETINIPEPDPIDFDIVATPIRCEPGNGGTSLGSITVQIVTGGVAPFRYFVTNNFNTTVTPNPYIASIGENFTFDIINFGEYTVTVIDANNCRLSKDVTIVSPPDDLIINIDTMPGDCATGGTAVVEATSPFGSGSYEFGILEFPTQPYTNTFLPADTPGGSVRTFTNLIPGIRYTFVVRDMVTNCFFIRTADITIPPASPLTVDLEINNVTCVGENDGSVTFTLDNFDASTTSIDFEIRQAFTNALIPGTDDMTTVTAGVPTVITAPNPGTLPPGQYFLVFTETGAGAFNGCQSASEIFEITESTLQLELTTSIDQNANCNVNSGRISGIATNGTPPYLYQATTTVNPPLATDSLWDTPNTFNLDANTYYIHVQDANGCIVTSPAIILPQDPEPVVQATLVEQCDIDNGDFAISVTLTTAGIGPHAYSIDGGVFQTRVAPFTLSNLTAGNHTVEVQDSNGCGNLVNVNIETPIDLTPEVTNLASCNANDGVVTVIGNGGTGSYTYSISPMDASITLNANVFSGVPSGTYTVTITDVTTSCTNTAEITLDAPTDVTFTTTSTDVSCNGGSDGIITVNLPASNDNPIYTYEITAPIVVAPQASNIFTDLPANTYTIRVTSGRNCFLIQDADPIEEPDPIVITPTAEEFACNADNVVNTVLLTINQTGGTPPYAYSLDDTNFFTSNEFDIVDTGVLQTINVFVRDNNGCTETTTIDIQPLTAITDATVTTTAAIDCNQTGQVTVNVIGGSAPGNLTYQLLPDGLPQASNVFTINNPGDYSFRINDNVTGCHFITNTPFTVLPFDNADIVLTPVNGVTCFGDTNGSFTLDVTGYTGAYTYEVFNNDGMSIAGPTTANTSTNPQTVSNLPGGNVTVTVTETDSPFCESMSNTITITSPTAPLTLMANETSNVTCDDNLGTITAVASGGWGGYQYELTGPVNVAPSTNGVFTGLSQGDYTVIVTDANGCVVTEPVSLELPDMITANVTANTTLLDCFGDTDAVITVSNVLGGQGSNYSYILNTVLPRPATSGPTQNPVFPNLGAGTYSVSIIDGFNCMFTSPEITINEPTEIQTALIQQTSATCLIDATLNLSASGGTPPYDYSLSNTFNTIEGNFTTDVTFAVTPGIYQYFVRDANGCSFNPTNEINVEEVPMLIVNLEDLDTDINCLGDNNGFIRASAQGGLGNYVYTLQDATTGANIAPVTQDTPGAFSNLPAGNYRIQVTSGDCIANSSDVQIMEPQNPLLATFNKTDITCFGENNGSLEIVATGGTGIIKYAIGPGQGQTFSPFIFSLELGQFFESPVFNNLPPGDFQAIAQDENGCLQFMEFTIEPAIPIVATIVPNSIVPEICNGDEDGIFTLNITGGVMPYSVAIDDINGPYTTGLPSQTDFDFTNLAGGEHTVFVRDALNCETEWDVALPESVLLNPTPVVSYTCDTSLTTVANTVFVAVDGSNTDLSQLDYSLDGITYQSSNTFNNLPVGLNNTIFVRHSNGCIKETEPFEIIDYQPLEITISDGNINEIVATATGGSGIYNYEIETLFSSRREPLGDSNTFRFFESGDYRVTVTDSFGCTATATRFFEFIDICILNYFTPNGDGNLDLWGPGCVQDFENLTFDIFDRYGRKIASLNAGELWDGKYNGVELPSGDYWYVIKLNDELDDREFVGNFTLYR